MVNGTGGLWEVGRADVGVVEKSPDAAAGEADTEGFGHDQIVVDFEARERAQALREGLRVVDAPEFFGFYEKNAETDSVEDLDAFIEVLKHRNKTSIEVMHETVSTTRRMECIGRKPRKNRENISRTMASTSTWIDCMCLKRLDPINQKQGHGPRTNATQSVGRPAAPQTFARTGRNRPRSQARICCG